MNPPSLPTVSGGQKVRRVALLLYPHETWRSRTQRSAKVAMKAVHSGGEKYFLLYPLDVSVAPGQHEPLRQRLNGVWLPPVEALVHPQIAPSTHAVLFRVNAQEQHLDERYRTHAADEHRHEASHRLLKHVADRPSMYALARRWFAQNKAGARLLRKDTLDEVLASGGRAFNLRVPTLT